MINKALIFLGLSALMVGAYFINQLALALYILVSIGMYYELKNIKFEYNKKWNYYFGFLNLLILSSYTYNREYFFYVLTCIILTDTSAMLFGKLFKGPKLLVNISPNKTHSGFICSILCCIIFGTIFANIQGYEIDLLFIKLLFIGLLATCGDLIESKFKRIVKIKDTSKLLGAHGGILDRIDSYLALSIIFVL